MEQQQNMRNEQNIGHIVRNKCAITNLSLTYKISFQRKYDNAQGLFLIKINLFLITN